MTLPRLPRSARLSRWTRALALLLACAAAPLSAQARDSTAAWKTVLTGPDGTVLAIDSATISRTGDAAFTVRTALRFPRRIALASGDTVDREVDTEELNCRGDSTRPLLSQEYDGEELVAMTILPKKWVPVAPGRRAVFDASCAWLLGGFAALLPRSYGLAEVEEQPELINREAVQATLSREYPRDLMAQGLTGSVLLRFRITEEGRADRTSLTTEEISHPGFADAAARVVYAMRFRPARLNGRPVPVWITVPVTFMIAYGPDRRAPGAPPPLPPLP
ncbi:MAG: energy transducer TonB [Longimicrobiaceae bacterium]